MASKRFTTNRALKNKVTGIDIYVPEYEESGGLVTGSAVFNIIVITRLFYYKTNQHKESDVVQFMIQRKYEEFEALYHKLTERFPSVLFPALPRRALIVSSGVLQDRKVVMSEVLQLVAKTQKLCCSPMVLQFLGVRGPQSKAEQERIENLQETAVVQEHTDTNRSIERAEAEDLFVADTVQVQDQAPEDGKDVTEDETILMEDPHQTLPANFSTLAKLSIFENEEAGHKEDDLFQDNKQIKEIILSKGTDSEEDSDLLEVRDDVDDLLSLSKKSEVKQIVKAKPKPKPRPSLKGKSPEKAAFQSGTEDDEIFVKRNKDGDKELWKEELEKVDETDLFHKARKQSLRKKGSGDKSLDDIFSAKDSKNLFDKPSEENLFSSKLETSHSQDIQTMNETDIMNYISENSSDPSNAQLDLGL